MASSPPTITRAPFSNSTKLIEVLTRDGCVIATDFTSSEDLHRVQQDVSPFMEEYTERRVRYLMSSTKKHLDGKQHCNKK